MTCTTTFRDVVTVQQDSSDAGDSEPDFSGTAFATSVPCRVTDVKGQEKYRGKQLVATTDFVVELWHYPGIVPDMRLSVTGGLHNTKTLNIIHVGEILQDGRPQEMLLQCRELTL